MNNKKIKYVRLFLPKEEMNKIDPRYRKRHIMLTSIMRDVTLLSKFIYYTKNNKPTEQILNYANTMASIFFLTTLISKIYEMWVFLTKNEILTELKNKSNSLELQRSIDDINKFFSNPKKRGIFEFIRHKFSCHYEYLDDVDSVINEAFEEFEENDFQMYLTEHDSANDIFPSLNSVILLCIFKEMDSLGFSESNQKKMETLFTLTGEGAGLVMKFCPIYLVEGFPIKWNQDGELEVDVPDISTIDLPIIVHKSSKTVKELTS